MTITFTQADRQAVVDCNDYTCTGLVLSEQDINNILDDVATAFRQQLTEEVEYMLEALVAFKGVSS